MPKLTYQELETAFSDLKEKYSLLHQEKESLREQLEICTRVPVLRSGIRGEVIISEVIGGKLTAHSAPHDILTSTGLKIEVKFANLRKIHGGQTRWSWANVLGLYGGKDFDRLLLIGVADSRYKNDYKDPDSPYVFFDISYHDVPKIMLKDHMIHTTTNPRSALSGTRFLLFTKFQVSLSDIQKRYGIKEITSRPPSAKSSIQVSQVFRQSPQENVKNAHLKIHSVRTKAEKIESEIRALEGLIAKSRPR